MPSYRDIEVSLQSQYDALSLPEFAATDPPLQASPRRGSGFFAYAPSDAPDALAVTEAYSPIYPGSQFWIMFRCIAPVEPEVRYYYFKLVVNGKAILSWGCGELDNFSGRVGFGIFAGTDSDDHGQPVIEKRAFIFPTLDENDAGGSFEIRVFRAKGRRREDRAIERWKEGAEGDGMKVNINFLKAGYLRPHEPRRMYAYALVDPVDKPYTSFVYHHYTSQRLRDDFGLDLPPNFDMEDITKASPRKKTPVTFSPLSPPPKEKPSPPPSEHLGKDSIALRKAQVADGSPAKPQRERKPFDALQGLTLAQPATDARSGPFPRQLFLTPRSASSSGTGILKDVAGRWRRRINSKDERNVFLLDRPSAG